jgi:hypothetical protein
MPFPGDKKMRVFKQFIIISPITVSENEDERKL